VTAARPPRYFAVIPAAGVGTRMRSDTPKQYLALRGRPVIQHVVERFRRHPAIAGVVVALAADDRRWGSLRFGGVARLETVVGGAERCHSVLAALDVLSQQADPMDWVLVHDAARPCLRGSDVDRLIEALADDPVGGLLALPVRDTMKRAAPDGSVAETVDRIGLWHALTPQMFRLDALRSALQAALARDILVTDEAQAMELAGMQPRLIEGSPDNIKITRPEDLDLAELYLRHQGEEAACV
jgi:2-C-methyl-D-erythritol 4-phosphate cytidylyltransferase